MEMGCKGGNDAYNYVCNYETRRRAACLAANGVWLSRFAAADLPDRPLDPSSTSSAPHPASLSLPTVQLSAKASLGSARLCSCDKGAR